MENLLARRATFKTIKQSTKADWDIIIAHHMPFAAQLPDRVLAQLRMLGRGRRRLRRQPAAAPAVERDTRARRR